MNGLRKNIVQKPFQIFYNKQGKKFTGNQVILLEVDDGSMACIYFYGYIPLELYNYSLCVDDWRKQELLPEDEYLENKKRKEEEALEKASAEKYFIL